MGVAGISLKRGADYLLRAQVVPAIQQAIGGRLAYLIRRGARFEGKRKAGC
jgi:hypothetical protein